MRRKLFLVVIAVAAVLYAGCAATQPTATLAPDRQVQTGPGKESNWDALVAAAKKEGEVFLYWEGNAEMQRKISRAFTDKFGIEVITYTASAAEMSERMSREYRVGIYNADAVMTGHYGMLTLLKPQGLISSLDPVVIAPDVLDPKTWIGGKVPFVDAERYQIQFGGTINSGLWRNTDMVKGTDVKEYQDLLDPKWKGKIAFQDPTVPGAGSVWFRLYYPVLGEAYMKALITQEPVVLRDKRLMVEWLARGKNPITLCANTETLLQFKSAGSPIEVIETKEGEYVSTGPGSIGIAARPPHPSAARPPHPSAARLWINWLLSKEGQTVWSQQILFPSFRADVPTGHLDRAIVPQPGKVYLSDTAQTLSESSRYLEMSKTIFTPLLKK